MPPKKTGLQTTEAQMKTRTLLTLWDLGGMKAEVKKTELTKRVQRTNEKAGDYQGIFEELEKEGAIAIDTRNRSVKVSLTDKGLEVLDAGLKNPDFKFGGRQVRAKEVDSLLKWIRHLNASMDVPVRQVKPAAAAIATYEDFKQVALEIYDQLNWHYNFDDLVPIYRMRREIGDRVTHTQFNEWMLEMQAEKILQLEGGSVEDRAQDLIQDCITTKESGLLCYAKRLTP